MEDEKDWKIASNTELSEECERLESIFTEKQNEMKQHVEAIQKLNEEMNSLSANYLEVRTILNKRIGKTDIF